MGFLGSFATRVAGGLIGQIGLAELVRDIGPAALDGLGGLGGEKGED